MYCLLVPSYPFLVSLLQLETLELLEGNGGGGGLTTLLGLFEGNEDTEQTITRVC